MKAINIVTTRQSPREPNTLHVSSFTVDSTLLPLWGILQHVFNTTSAAAGWRRSGGSGSSPPQGATCCAKRWLASRGSRGSAANKRQFIRTPSHERHSLAFQFAQWELMCFVFTLSSVPDSRIPTCCILLEVATDLPQHHTFLVQC